MEEFAEEADDKSMIKLLKYYRKHHGMRMSRYIAVNYIRQNMYAS